MDYSDMTIWQLAQERDKIAAEFKKRYPGREDASVVAEEAPLRQVGQVMYDMAQDGKCGPVAWFESMGSLPDGTPIYVRLDMNPVR